MEAFSLLKYWRGGGGDSGVNPKPASTAAEIQNDNNSIENDNDEDDDDGPFFDLEFSDDDDEESTKSEEEEEEEEEEEGGEREFKLSTDEGDTGDLLFKGKLVPVESPTSSSDNQKPQFPVSSLIKSATKLRVFMLNGLKKPPKTNNAPDKTTESTNAVDSPPTAAARKLFTVKFKVEEVPIVSLFTRDNSSRSGDSTAAKSREVVQRYLKKVKPLYVRVSRRHAAEESKGMSLPAGLRVVCKHLGKSRSASSPAVIAAAAPAEAPPPGTASSRRRDDSLIQQQDGIQSAILHCKRSFNASTEDSEGSLLSRCASDPSNEKKCLDLSRKSSDGIQRA